MKDKQRADEADELDIRGKVDVENLLEWVADQACDYGADDEVDYDPERCSPHHTGRCWPCESRRLLELEQAGIEVGPTPGKEVIDGELDIRGKMYEAHIRLRNALGQLRGGGVRGEDFEHAVDLACAELLAIPERQREDAKRRHDMAKENSALSDKLAEAYVLAGRLLDTLSTPDAERCRECGSPAAQCQSEHSVAGLGGTVVQCERREGHQGRHEHDRWYWAR